MSRNKSEAYDYLVKVVIIGDSAVGKTNILLRYTDDLYRATHTSTIGVDFKVKTINVEDTKIKMQIWDTAGQDRFRNITKTYYKGSAGVIFVYSVTDRKTFNNIESWIKQVQQHQSSENVSKLIIGNKIDCKDQERQVSYQQQGKKLAQRFKVEFMEVSAKENINIQDTFDLMGKMIKENRKQQDNRNSLRQPFKFGQEKTKNKKKKCC